MHHRDTAHAHVHIVANRVHPDTGKTWKAPHWQRGLHVLCRRFEREMGWRIVPSDRAPDRPRADRVALSRWPKRSTSRAGLVFTDGKRQMSASRVHRDLSRPKLERRFGRSLEESRAAVERIRQRMDFA